MRLVESFACLCLIAASAEAVAVDFNDYWRDGQAELSGYQLTVSRYGEPRIGHAVLIYVTEPFSESQRVKVDDWQRNPADTVDAFKLNLVRDFQTGIYDYNTMVSVFLRSADFSPLKITFSSAEWCGHVYEELIFRKDKVTGHYASYFEGESAEHALPFPAGGITEDALFILLRGLHGAFLAPGESRTVPFLPSAYFARLHHQPLAWTTTRIERAAGDEIIYTVTIQEGRKGKFWVESKYPHRITRWELLPDIRAELTGSVRLPYWKLHGNGDEKLLQRLGLPAPKPEN